MAGSMAHRSRRAKDADRARRMAQAFELGAFALGVALQAWANKLAEPAEQTDAEPPDRGAAAGSGSNSSSPARIPPREWRAILTRTAKKFQKNETTSVAGGVAYAVILAIFPAMAAFVALYGLFADPSAVRHQLSMLNGVMPSSALELVKSQLHRIVAASPSGLSLACVVGILVALWTATAGMRAMVRGLNIAYETPETRGFIRLTLLCLALTLGGVLFLIAASAAVIAAPVVLSVLHLSGLIGGLAALRWPLLFVIAVLSLAVLYRFGPNRAEPRWRWVTPGSLAASVLWLLGSAAFSWYIANFGHYDATYGSLGALFGFLTWLWLSAVIVLFGAELNGEVERRTPPAELGAKAARAPPLRRKKHGAPRT
jgi:membrane protein